MTKASARAFYVRIKTGVADGSISPANAKRLIVALAGCVVDAAQKAELVALCEEQSAGDKGSNGVRDAAIAALRDATSAAEIARIGADYAAARGGKATLSDVEISALTS